MFSIGLDEPLQESRRLVRHSLIWTGDYLGEGARGLPETHPLSRAVARLIECYSSEGVWLLSVSRMRAPGAQGRLLEKRLSLSRWHVESETPECLSAFKILSSTDYWPLTTWAGLPRIRSMVLLLGLAQHHTLDCNLEEQRPRAVPGERMVLDDHVADHIVASGGCAVCFGRSEIESRPGISIIGAHSFEPSTILAREMIGRVFVGPDADRAWSAA